MAYFYVCNCCRKIVNEFHAHELTIQEGITPNKYMLCDTCARSLIENLDKKPSYAADWLGKEKGDDES